MKISLCNEVIREMEFEEQCRFCKSLGYDGLELAPFTIDENPHLIPSAKTGTAQNRSGKRRCTDYRSALVADIAKRPVDHQ